MSHLRIVIQNNEKDPIAEVYNIRDSEIPKVGSIIQVRGAHLYVRNVVHSYEKAHDFEELGFKSNPLIHDTWFIVEVK